MNQHKYFTGYSRQLIVAIVILSIGGFSASGYPDVYNFYFKQKKKKQQENKIVAPPQEGEEESEEEAKPPQEAAKSETEAQTLKATAETTPLIINNYNTNTNNNDNTSQPTTTIPGAVVSTPVDAPTATTTSVVSITTKKPRRNPFYVGASGLLMEDANRIGGRLGWGGVFNVGLDVSKAIALNLYGGTRVLNTDSIKFHAGLDLEVMPFRLPVADDWDFFKIGPMIGVSTAAATYSNIGSIHVGARTTLQVTRELAFTAASRINLGMLAFEAGMVTRF